LDHGIIEAIWDASREARADVRRTRARSEAARRQSLALRAQFERRRPTLADLAAEASEG
jgi:hypothetical protein